jgi:hypothetical protein
MKPPAGIAWLLCRGRNLELFSNSKVIWKFIGNWKSKIYFYSNSKDFQLSLELDLRFELRKNEETGVPWNNTIALASAMAWAMSTGGSTVRAGKKFTMVCVCFVCF